MLHPKVLLNFINLTLVMGVPYACKLLAVNTICYDKKFPQINGPSLVWKEIHKKIDKPERNVYASLVMIKMPANVWSYFHHAIFSYILPQIIVYIESYLIGCSCLTL